MKVYFSPASPFVRKVMVCAHELGVADQIEQLPCAANPINRDKTIVAANPLGQVPTFFADDGTILFDSRTICEYVDAHGGGQLFPPGEARWRALRDQSLGDGVLDAALLARYETVVRPGALQWQAWLDGQLEKVTSCLDVIEADAAGYGDRVDIGAITVGCALGYLDFRFPHLPWRAGRPQAAKWFARFSERPSMRATAPFDAGVPKR